MPTTKKKKKQDVKFVKIYRNVSQFNNMNYHVGHVQYLGKKLNKATIRNIRVEPIAIISCDNNNVLISAKELIGKELHVWPDEIEPMTDTSSYIEAVYNASLE
jgi:hypothetical protein